MNYTNSVRFEWDPSKAATNQRKHGVGFDEAATVFADPLALYLQDRSHPERAVLVGASSQQRVIVTVFVEYTGDVVRIISARRATTHERRTYENGDV